MKHFMQEAVRLAATVDPHLTAPNPRVGCVVVQGDEIISQGVHEYFGGEHAEAKALKKIPTGCDIYITLEPCDHFHGKKTPSCTEKIIGIKPRKIYVGALDPKFQGRNLKKLAAAGIEIEVLNNRECNALNPFLAKWHSDSPYPYVCLKIAQSLDGRITKSEPGLYITNSKSRAWVHRLRAQYSGLLTSTETVLRDNPRLNVRLNNPGNLPGYEASNPKVFIIGNRKIDTAFTQYQTNNLEFVLRDLKNKGIDSVLVEVGQTLNTELLKQGLVDEIQMFTAPVFLGDDEKASFAAAVALNDFKLVEMEDLSGDVWLRYLKNSLP